MYRKLFAGHFATGLVAASLVETGGGSRAGRSAATQSAVLQAGPQGNANDTRGTLAQQPAEDSRQRLLRTVLLVLLVLLVLAILPALGLH